MQTSKEKQDQRKAELQAAALRDGFETWSQAITAWKNGEARLTKRAPDAGAGAVIIGQLPVPHAGNANRWADAPPKGSHEIH